MLNIFAAHVSFVFFAFANVNQDLVKEVERRIDTRITDGNWTRANVKSDGYMTPRYWDFNLPRETSNAEERYIICDYQKAGWREVRVVRTNTTYTIRLYE